MQKCASSDLARFLVLPSAYSQDPCTNFYDITLHTNVPLGVMKTKFYILTPFPQKMDILGLLKVEFALPMHFNFINIANDITIFL